MRYVTTIAVVIVAAAGVAAPAAFARGIRGPLHHRSGDGPQLGRWSGTSRGGATVDLVLARRGRSIEVVDLVAHCATNFGAPIDPTGFRVDSTNPVDPAQPVGTDGTFGDWLAPTGLGLAGQYGRLDGSSGTVTVGAADVASLIDPDEKTPLHCAQRALRDVPVHPARARMVRDGMYAVRGIANGPTLFSNGKVRVSGRGALMNWFVGFGTPVTSDPESQDCLEALDTVDYAKTLFPDAKAPRVAFDDSEVTADPTSVDNLAFSGSFESARTAVLGYVASSTPSESPGKSCTGGGTFTLRYAGKPTSPFNYG